MWPGTWTDLAIRVERPMRAEVAARAAGDLCDGEGGGRWRRAVSARRVRPPRSAATFGRRVVCDSEMKAACVRLRRSCVARAVLRWLHHGGTRIRPCAGPRSACEAMPNSAGPGRYMRPASLRWARRRGVSATGRPLRVVGPARVDGLPLGWAARRYGHALAALQGGLGLLEARPFSCTECGYWCGSVRRCLPLSAKGRLARLARRRRALRPLYKAAHNSRTRAPVVPVLQNLDSFCETWSGTR